MARARSPQAHDKVLRAALDLFGERGIDATSMDAIAQHSGVSKATIYNHWPDKEALLMEVMIMIHGLDRQREDIDSGDLQRDLTTVLTRRPPDQFDEARMRMTPSLIAYSAIHPEFGKAWRHQGDGASTRGHQENSPPRHSAPPLPRKLDLTHPSPYCLALYSTTTSSIRKPKSSPQI